MTFDEVDGRLTVEMRRVLRLLADAHAGGTGERRFLIIRSFGGTLVVSTFAEGQDFRRDDIDPGVIDDLGRLGLVQTRLGTRGEGFRVTSDGERFAAWLLVKAGEAVEHVEETSVRFVTGDAFAVRHPAAAQALAEASKVVAAGAVDNESVRAVGVLLRHALQDVAATTDPSGNPEKPADRLTAWRDSLVIEERQAAVIDALVALTRTVLAVDQGAAHIKETPSRIESLDELRRAVFLTTITAYEIDCAIQHQRR